MHQKGTEITRTWNVTAGPKSEEKMTPVNDELKKVDALDFRNNKTQLIESYLLRMIGVVVFGMLFMLWISLITPNPSMKLETLLNIEIANLPPVVSILFIILDVILVLYLHELIHASVFYITHKQHPKIGMRGFVIFAAAPSHLLARHQLVINALSPFFVISTFGASILFFIPTDWIAWIFIPTVVNAAASGGDFMAVVWALRHDKHVVYNDDGDIITAYSK